MIHYLFGFSVVGLISKPRVWATLRRFLLLLPVENFWCSLEFLFHPSIASCSLAYHCTFVHRKHSSPLKIISQYINTFVIIIILFIRSPYFVFTFWRLVRILNLILFSPCSRSLFCSVPSVKSPCPLSALIRLHNTLMSELLAPSPFSRLFSSWQTEKLLPLLVLMMILAGRTGKTFAWLQEVQEN